MASIALVAALSATLLPALASAQARARQSSCVNNLRQLGVAALQYAADYDGTLPFTSHSGGELAWGETLRLYGVTPALRICPADPDASARRAQGGTSYAWNENLLAEVTQAHSAGSPRTTVYANSPTLELLPQPTLTLLLVEQSPLSGTDSHGDHIHNRAWKRFPERLERLLQSDLALRRHAGGSLLTCADGHVQHFPSGTLEAEARQGHDPLRLSF